ncbi:MAG: GNAT family N-acetyltransferase [Betaproteobacteria bacterium]
MGALVYGQDERVTAWVAAQSGDAPPPPTAAVGYERNGELAAGTYFDGCSDNNIFCHIASTGLLPRELLQAAMAYAYRQLELERMTLIVHDDNERCINLCLGLGAELEGVMARARKGGDILLFVLWNTNRFWRRLCESGRA